MELSTFDTAILQTTLRQPVRAEFPSLPLGATRCGLPSSLTICSPHTVRLDRRNMKGIRPA
jgi:hypothetical protein